jgi:hypothetical protein
MRRVVYCVAGGAAILVASWFGFFFFRDNFSTHWPIKVLSAASFRGGAIPWWNFSAGGGQPLAGNPNTLTFYPDNILYLFLPTRVAFNLHFWIHLAIAFAAMRGLAGELGMQRRIANLTAVIYALSGVVISATAFYNMIAAAALVPLALLCAERLLRLGRAADSLALGATCGLLALAGEPVQVGGTALALLLVMFVRRTNGTASPQPPTPNLHTLLVWLVLAGLTAVVVVAPLLVAWQEIAAEVERGAFRYSAQTVLAASLAPLRLLEVLVGPFHGLIGDAGPSGYHSRPGGWPPLFASALIGILALPALFSRTAPRRYQWMAAVMAFLALGAFNPIVRVPVESLASLRIARYPEKLILPMTVALVVLVGMYLERQASRRVETLLLWLTLLPLMVIGGDWLRRGGQRLGMNVALVLVAALLAFAVARMTAPRERLLIVMLTLLPLGYWALRTIPLDWFAQYSFAPRSSPVRLAHAVGEAIVLPSGADDIRIGYRLRYRRHDPLSAAVAGYRYALERSPDGMYSALSRFVQERFASAPAVLQLRYARLVGCQFVLARQPIGPGAQWTTIGVERIAVTPVDRPLPEVFAAQRIVPVSSIQQAVHEVESPSFDDQNTVVGPRELTATPIARPLELTSRLRGDVIEVAVRATTEAVLVVNESYLSAWTAIARDDSGTVRLLDTFPANIDRLGIVVPPGRWTIDVRFGRRRQLVAIAWALSSLALAATAVVVWRSRKESASPAR